jgi:hypothetical protein
MRRTVDYRSALVMAATLGGSALAQASAVRAEPEHYWTGAAEPAYARCIAEPSIQARAAPVAQGHEPRPG